MDIQTAIDTLTDLIVKFSAESSRCAREVEPLQSGYWDNARNALETAISELRSVLQAEYDANDPFNDQGNDLTDNSANDPNYTKPNDDDPGSEFDHFFDDPSPQKPKPNKPDDDFGDNFGDEPSQKPKSNKPDDDFGSNFGDEPPNDGFDTGDKGWGKD